LVVGPFSPNRPKRDKQPNQKSKSRSSDFLGPAEAIISFSR